MKIVNIFKGFIIIIIINYLIDSHTMYASCLSCAMYFSSKELQIIFCSMKLMKSYTSFCQPSFIRFTGESLKIEKEQRKSYWDLNYFCLSLKVNSANRIV